MRAIKFLRDLRFKFKRGAPSRNLKSKFQSGACAFLKFKSEILKSALPFAIPVRSKPFRI